MKHLHTTSALDIEADPEGARTFLETASWPSCLLGTFYFLNQKLPKELYQSALCWSGDHLVRSGSRTTMVLWGRRQAVIITTTTSSSPQADEITDLDNQSLSQFRKCCRMLSAQHSQPWVSLLSYLNSTAWPGTRVVSHLLGKSKIMYLEKLRLTKPLAGQVLVRKQGLILWCAVEVSVSGKREFDGCSWWEDIPWEQILSVESRHLCFPFVFKTLWSRHQADWVTS